MKAVRGVDGAATVVDVDEPPGLGTEVLEMRSASICSSDLMYLEMGTTRVIGHELAGVREDGTPVVVEGLYGCGTCDLCRSGRYNLCPTHPERALGVSADGGMAERYRAPAERLIPIPDGLDVADASIVEPTAVSWHALRLGGTAPGTRVAIVGAGGLGLLAIPGARRLGAEEVAVEARHPHQREAAERLGGTVGTHGLYDVVVEAAGTTESLARCTELVAPGGTISVLGVHMSPTLEVPWPTLFLREARIVPSIGYCAHEGGVEMAEAAAMLAAEPDIARTVITHRFPLEDAAEAFRVAADKSTKAIRVVLEP